jgi:hypothetical protein
MGEERDSRGKERGTVLDRRTALRVYVPPTLAAIGALTVVGYKHSGGGTTAPRSFAGAARDHRHGHTAR